MLSSKNFGLIQKICHINFVTIKNVLLKNTYKVALQYLFNVVIIFYTVFYLKLYFKVKIEPKMCTFKKPGGNFEGENLPEIIDNPKVS